MLTISILHAYRYQASVGNGVDGQTDLKHNHDLKSGQLMLVNAEPEVRCFSKRVNALDCIRL